MQPNSWIRKEIDIIKAQLERYRAEGKKIFATSSFQTHSIPMLHILSVIDSNIPIYFLETGFHFPETIVYRNRITELLGLNLVSLSSPISMNQQKDLSGNLLFTTNPDRCCLLNKTLPLEPILAQFNVWITGVRADQSQHRGTLSIESQGKFESLRYHPMLNWNSKMIFEYRQKYELPEHPLDQDGYLSIGCEPCTAKFYETRTGSRWVGQKKTECGLHTTLLVDKVKSS